MERVLLGIDRPQDDAVGQSIVDHDLDHEERDAGEQDQRNQPGQATAEQVASKVIRGPGFNFSGGAKVLVSMASSLFFRIRLQVPATRPSMTSTCPQTRS